MTAETPRPAPSRMTDWVLVKRSAIYCLVTKNPFGSDTWAIGQSCQCANCQAMLAAAPCAPSWLPGVPDIEAGHGRRFLIAFRTSYMKPEHKTIVGEAWYLNAKRLDTEDDRLVEADDNEDGFPFTGWHFLKEHVSYDEYYEAIGSDTMILGYQPLPEPPK